MVGRGAVVLAFGSTHIASKVDGLIKEPDAEVEVGAGWSCGCVDRSREEAEGGGC